jgi:hypothetical protein
MWHSRDSGGSREIPLVSSMQRLAAMSTVDRMFRVIVAGGIALTAAAPGFVVGCGGSVPTTPATASDGGHGADAFPAEGPAQQPDAFPQEGIDTGVNVTDAGGDEKPVDAGGDEDVFPQEGPNLEAGFPQETASK